MVLCCNAVFLFMSMHRVISILLIGAECQNDAKLEARASYTRHCDALLFTKYLCFNHDDRVVIRAQAQDDEWIHVTYTWSYRQVKRMCIRYVSFKESWIIRHVWQSGPTKGLYLGGLLDDRR